MSEIKNRLLLLIEQACRQLAVIVGKTRWMTVVISIFQ